MDLCRNGYYCDTFQPIRYGITIVRGVVAKKDLGRVVLTKVRRTKIETRHIKNTHHHGDSNAISISVILLTMLLADT